MQFIVFDYGDSGRFFSLHKLKYKYTDCLVDQCGIDREQVIIEIQRHEVDSNVMVNLLSKRIGRILLCSAKG